MANLTDFIAEIKTQGLMRTANYTVEITTPKKMFGEKHLQRVQLFCDRVDVPGVSIATAPNRSYGEVREVPYEKLYGTIGMSFFVDNNMSTKEFFDDWINVIQNPLTRSFEYYENYISDIVINVEDIQENSRYSIKLFECYPKSISAISMDYASLDVMKLQVEMNYKYWQQNKPLTSYLTPADLNLGYNDAWMQDYSMFQKQFNTYQPESTGIFTGITKF